MQSGKMDKRVTLRRPSTTRNEFGESVEVFVDVAQTFARLIQSKAGAETLAVDQHTARQPAIFEIRFRSDVGPKWRLVYRGREYDIEDAGEIGRREGIRLTTYARDVVPSTPPAAAPNAEHQ